MLHHKVGSNGKSAQYCNLCSWEIRSRHRIPKWSKLIPCERFWLVVSAILFFLNLVVLETTMFIFVYYIFIFIIQFAIQLYHLNFTKCLSADSNKLLNSSLGIKFISTEMKISFCRIFHDVCYYPNCMSLKVMIRRMVWKTYQLIFFGISQKCSFTFISITFKWKFSRKITNPVIYERGYPFYKVMDRTVYKVMEGKIQYRISRFTMRRCNCKECLKSK